MGGGGSNEMEVVISGDASGLETALSSGMASIGSMEKKVAGLGVALGALAVGGIAKSIGAASSLDAALVESQAIMGDLTSNEMKAMEQAARDVAKTTTFSADQAGESFYFLASAGMDAEQSVAALPQVAAFAQAGMFDMATATDLATDAQSALGMTSDDAQENLKGLTRVTDVLVGANTLANASVEQFSEALTNKAGAALKSTNKSIEEGVSVLAAYADQGIKGRLAGERLNIVIRDLQKSAQENSDAFDELGVSVFDAEGEMRPMHAIIKDLEDATEGMSTKQKNAALATLGLSQQAQDGITPLLGMSGAIANYEKELKNAGGTTDEVAQNQLKSFQSQLALAKSAIVDVAIGIGQVFLPHLTAMVSKLTGAINAFGEFNNRLGGLPGAVALVATAIGGFSVAAAALTSTLGAGLIPMMVSMGAAVAAVAAPITAATLAVVALHRAWTTNFAGIRDVTMQVVGALKAEFAETAAVLRDVLGPSVTGLGGDFTTFAGRVEAAIAPVIALVGTRLVGAIQKAGPIIRQGIMSAAQGFETFRATVARVIGIATGIWQTHASTVRGVLTRIQTALSGLAARLSPILDPLRRLAERLGFITQTGQPTIKTLAKVALTIAGITNPILTVIGAISLLRTAWTEDIGGIQGITQTATQAIKGAWNTNITPLAQSTRGTMAQIRAAVANTLNPLTSFITKSLGVYQGLFRQHWGAISGDTRASFGMVRTIIAGIMAAVQQLIQPVLQRLAVFWTQHGDQVVRVVAKLQTVVLRIVTTMMRAILTAIRPVLNLLAQAWAKWGDEITAIVSFAFDAILSTLGWALGAMETALDAALMVMDGDWRGAWTRIKEFLVSTLNGIGEFTRKWFGRFVGWIATGLTNAFNKFKEWGRNLIFGSLVKDIFNAIGSFVQSWFSGFVRRVGAGVNQAFQHFQTGMRKIHGVVKDIFNRIISFVISKVGAYKNAVGRVVNAGKAVIDSKKSAYRNAGKGLINTFKDGALSRMKAVQNAVGRIMQAARDKLPGSDAKEGPLADLTKAGRALSETFASGMASARRSISTAGDQIAHEARKLVPVFAQAFGAAKDNAIRHSAELRRRVANGIIPSTMQSMKQSASRFVGPFQASFQTAKTRAIGHFADLKRRAGDGIVPSMTRSMIRSASRFVGPFLKPFRDAKSRAIGQFRDLKRRLVGNSVLPDTLSMMIRNADQFVRPFLKPFRDAKARALREFDALQKRLKGKVSKIKNTLSNLTKKKGGGFGSIAEARKWVDSRAKGRKLTDGLSKVRDLRKLAARIRRDMPGYSMHKDDLMGASVGQITKILQRGARGDRTWNHAAHSGGSDLQTAVYNALVTRGVAKNLYKGMVGMAEGGLVTGPTSALIGEGGEDEAVLPLSKLNRLVANATRVGAKSAIRAERRTGSRRGGHTFHVTINAEPGMDGRTLGREFTRELRSQNFD